MADHRHTHNHSATGSIGLAFLLNLSFAVVEIIGGLWTNSVAILSDAVHDFGDSISLASAWYLERYSRRRRDPVYTYGYQRFSILGALITAVVLLVGAFFVLSEAIPRLWQPEAAHAPGMIIFAVLGILVNGIAALRLRGRSSLNAAMAAWHLLEDILGWIGVLIVAIVLLFTDLYILDPILSIMITLFVLYNVVRNLRKTLKVFLQATPEGLEIARVEEHIVSLPQVGRVHHTHIWSLDGEHHVLTTHVVLTEGTGSQDITDIKQEIRKKAEELGIWHTTIEIEYAPGDCRHGECD
jgi:cobalt-zinc-cadmium efflux system protein